jgi:hypothetical protein
MILGRPVNLWLGVTTAAAGFISVSAIAAGADPVIVANLTGAGAGVMGAVIALVAGQPPTVTAGSTVNVVTPKGQQDYAVEV